MNDKELPLTLQWCDSISKDFLLYLGKLSQSDSLILFLLLYTFVMAETFDLDFIAGNEKAQTPQGRYTSSHGI